MTKVKDIELVLQELIKRVFNPSVNANADANYILSLVSEGNWKIASNEERLAYCRLRFSKGTKIYDNDGTIIESDGVPHISGLNNSVRMATPRGGISLYDSETGKFAEVVCPIKEELETKFKKGEIVEISDDGVDFSKYSNHTHKYSGAKRIYDGHFIVENQDGFISTSKFIRKPDVDKKYRDVAKEIMKEHLGHGYGLFSGVQILQTEFMLIEALKRTV